MIVNCSDCGAPLINFAIVDPELDISWNCICKCGHCGDYSFSWDAVGTYAVDDTEYSTVIDISMNDNNVIFHTKPIKTFSKA